jgi:hypothetical protein
MKLCRLGIHKYKTLGTQKVSNVVGGFSETELQREVLKCKCGKIKSNIFYFTTFTFG